MIWSKAFWLGAFERSLKTFSQTAVAVLMADSVIGLLDVNLGELLSVAGLAAVVSVLTSVGNADYVAGNIANK